VNDAFGPVESPVWLIADSQPAKWAEKLEHPLDPRHPTRHSIWTPIENYIQEALFRKSKSRVDVDAFYITNAINDASLKPGRLEDWDKLDDRIEKVRELIEGNRPRMILTFGSFSFELLRRAKTETPRNPTYWTCHRLGEEFSRRAKSWDDECPNLLPLLHATIARGRFLEAHKLFCGNRQHNPNYFSYVGYELANILSTKFVNCEILR
jgi:hypothetical protein